MLARRTPGAGKCLDTGHAGDGMVYLRSDAGSPLTFMPGLSAPHRPPHGVDRWFQPGRSGRSPATVTWRSPGASARGRPGQAHE
jgi:hypothetical protein